MAATVVATTPRRGQTLEKTRLPADPERGIGVIERAFRMLRCAMSSGILYNRPDRSPAACSTRVNACRRAGNYGSTRSIARRPRAWRLSFPDQASRELPRSDARRRCARRSADRRCASARSAPIPVLGLVRGHDRLIVASGVFQRSAHVSGVCRISVPRPPSVSDSAKPSCASFGKPRNSMTGSQAPRCACATARARSRLRCAFSRRIGVCSRNCSR